MGRNNALVQIIFGPDNYSIGNDTHWYETHEISKDENGILCTTAMRRNRRVTIQVPNKYTWISYPRESAVDRKQSIGGHQEDGLAPIFVS